jgi:hypothetical protein
MFGWLSKQTEKLDGVHVTVLGLLLYVTVYFSYSTFYRRFGVSPAEVGLTYGEILIRSGPLLVVATVSVAVFTYVVSRLLASDPKSQGDPKSQTKWIRHVLLSLMLVIGVVLVTGIWRAQQLADLVDRGTPVRSRFLELIDVRVDYVTVSAGDGGQPAEVGSGPTTTTSIAGAGRFSTEAVEPPPDPATHLRPLPTIPALSGDAVTGPTRSLLDVTRRRSLLYLGQGNDVVVFYDPYQHQTVRVPASQVTLYSE